MARQRSGAVTAEQPVVEQGAQPRGGVEMLKCDACTMQSSRDLVMKHAGKCPRCEEPMAYVVGVDLAGDKMFVSEAVAAKAPARERKTCPVDGCGAEMTETSLDGGKWFCPDASTKHPRLGVEQAKGSTSTVPDVHRGDGARKPTALGYNAPAFEKLTVVVAPMTFSPNEYHSFEVGPFECVLDLRKDGADVDAVLRELHEVQRKAFETQLEAYRSFMKQLYGEKGRR